MTTAVEQSPHPAERDGRQRTILTPEGVALSLRRAGIGDRFMAVLVDLVIVVALLFAIGFAFVAVAHAFDMPVAFAQWGIATVLVASFLLRTFYFAAFELRWQGRTPGKRLLRIRVIDRHGRPLTAGAIFARNLAREVELFLPLSLLTAGGGAGADGWIRLATLAWLGLFLAMPLFNRDRLRVGDLIGGTLVIANPKAVLLDDVAGPAKAATPGDRFRFTPAQVQTYGIHELQTLEEVLRLQGPAALATRRAVAEKIRQRIGWTEDNGDPAAATENPGEADPRPFLEAYYAALRANLETGLLFGRRRLRQSAKAPMPPTS